MSAVTSDPVLETKLARLSTLLGNELVLDQPVKLKIATVKLVTYKTTLKTAK